MKRDPYYNPGNKVSINMEVLEVKISKDKISYVLFVPGSKIPYLNCVTVPEDQIFVIDPTA